ncbi:hypothetical protein HK104_006060 [Borealophlyctis nickersoniae]|nr:hypothetical protein HK104_006060 [Borealophlyctis nickersoniae]
MSFGQASDEVFLRRAIQLARAARERGDNPFGAVIVGERSERGNIVIEVKDAAVSSGDPTAHAETEAVRKLAKEFRVSYDDASKYTIYISTERTLCRLAVSAPRLNVDSRGLLGFGSRTIEIVGPLLEDEGLDVHTGYWEMK